MSRAQRELLVQISNLLAIRGGSLWRHQQCSPPCTPPSPGQHDRRHNPALTQAQPSPSGHLCCHLQPGRQADSSVLLPQPQLYDPIQRPRIPAQEKLRQRLEKVQKAFYCSPGCRSPGRQQGGLQWSCLTSHRPSRGWEQSTLTTSTLVGEQQGGESSRKNKCLCMSHVFIAHKLGVCGPRRQSPSAEREVGRGSVLSSWGARGSAAVQAVSGAAGC